MPKRGLLELDLFLHRRVRRVVGGHGVDGAVGERLAQHVHVGLAAQRRVAFAARVVGGAGFVGEREVVGRDLAGHRQAAPLRLAHQPHRLGAVESAPRGSGRPSARKARGRARPWSLRRSGLSRGGRAASRRRPRSSPRRRRGSRSSQCCTTGRSKVRAYSRARRMSSAFITGRPSSDTATQPGLLELAHLGERFAREPLRDRADRINAHGRPPRGRAAR